MDKLSTLFPSRKRSSNVESTTATTTITTATVFALQVTQADSITDTEAANVDIKRRKVNIDIPYEVNIDDTPYENNPIISDSCEESRKSCDKQDYWDLIQTESDYWFMGHSHSVFDTSYNYPPLVHPNIHNVTINSSAENQNTNKNDFMIADKCYGESSKSCDEHVSVDLLQSESNDWSAVQVQVQKEEEHSTLNQFPITTKDNTFDASDNYYSLDQTNVHNMKISSIAEKQYTNKNDFTVSNECYGESTGPLGKQNACGLIQSESECKPEGQAQEKKRSTFN